MRMVAATLMFCCAANVQAAGDETNGHAYFTKAELPDINLRLSIWGLIDYNLLIFFHTFLFLSAKIRLLPSLKEWFLVTRYSSIAAFSSTLG